MILEYPRLDMEVISTVTLNAVQMMQLREQIAATQNTALIVGLLIGGCMGAIGVIAAWYYLSSKRFA
jgi:F0F1-type ATP synthase assembly protein I